ncbi:hypothetical protein RRG08_055628 [Elysia crispata]|uniref:Uncharacterized protein n=1 Tax=Elysia crispata TaxID=231223 RepID=A0AAE0Z7Z8_9GAST|nr:hypothetical protein RRG08_055628 [Elysia crispata]
MTFEKKKSHSKGQSKGNNASEGLAAGLQVETTVAQRRGHKTTPRQYLMNIYDPQHIEALPGLRCGRRCDWM